MTNSLEELSEAQVSQLVSRLRGLALHLVADESVADDLAQEAWIVLEARRSHGIRDLRAFMKGVLRKLHLRHRDREARRTRRERSAAVTESASFDSMLDVQEILVQELRELPEPLRQVVLMRFYEDLSSAEISRRLDLPGSTVRSRLARGLDELRQRLDRRCDGGRVVWASALLESSREAYLASGTSVGVGALVAAGSLVVCFGLGAWLWPDKESSAAEAGEGVELVVTESFLSSEGSELDELAEAPLEFASVEPGETSRAPASTTAVGPETPIRTVRVIDRDRGTPLADYIVLVDDHSNPRKGTRYVVSDAAGEFLLRDESDTWSFTLTANDHPETRIESPFRWNLMESATSRPDQVLEFEVVTGPTYRLELPAGTPTGSALYADDEFAPEFSMNWRKRESKLFAALDDHGFDKEGHTMLTVMNGEFATGSWNAVVREGNPPWIRFAPRHARASAGESGPWFIRLSDRMGLWQAWAEVDSIDGEYNRVVVFEEKPFGRVVIDVESEGGKLAEGLSVRVQRVGASESDRDNDRWAGFRVPGNGDRSYSAVTMKYLSPGDYTAKFSGGGYKPQTTEFRITTRETTQLRLKIRRDARAHDLVVVLGSQSGEIEFPNPLVSLISTDPSVASRRAWAAQVTRENPGEARFHFENLEPCAWQVKIGQQGQLPPFDPPNGFVLEPGTEEIRFLCLGMEGQGVVSPKVTALDAETGEGVGAWGYAIWLEEPEPIQARVASFSLGSGEVDERVTVKLPLIRVGALCDWLITADGYRPHFQSRGSYPPELTGPEDGAFRLERGWGVMILARRQIKSSRSPVPNVEVLVDGQMVGTTDQWGRYLISGETAPETIELRHELYNHVQGISDPNTGRVTATPFAGSGFAFFEDR